MSQQISLDERTGLRRRLLLKVLHSYFALSRGVRAACFNPQGEIFLVRHSYVPGWYMPGGGVERNETVLKALEKELREEGNLELTAPPQLFHVYFNRRISPRDHVLLYRAEVIQTAPRLADREIVEAGFFDPLDVPKDVTSATLRRLAELSGEVSPADIW